MRGGARQALAVYRAGLLSLSIALLLIIPLISYELIGRNLSLGSVSWIEEVCKLIELWVGVLFIPLVQFDERHIAANLFTPRRPAARLAMTLLRHFVFLAIGAAWIWLGAVMVYKERNMTSAGGLELPLIFTNMVLPISGALIVVTAVIQAARAILHGPAETQGAHSAGMASPE
jgi:TRAP-type C4-dicarboxylate transport system permease small subunit